MLACTWGSLACTWGAAACTWGRSPVHGARDDFPGASDSSVPAPTLSLIKVMNAELPTADASSCAAGHRNRVPCPEEPGTDRRRPRRAAAQALSTRRTRANYSPVSSCDAGCLYIGELPSDERAGPELKQLCSSPEPSQDIRGAKVCLCSMAALKHSLPGSAHLHSAGNDSRTCAFEKLDGMATTSHTLLLA